MKIGIDYHGVLDKYPDKFIDLAKRIIHTGGECHLITGHPINNKFLNKMKKICPRYRELFRDHVFSTTDELTKYNFPYTIDNKGGKIFSEEAWNSAKSIYCKQNDIDIMFDDSDIYGKYFKDKTVYVRVE